MTDETTDTTPDPGTTQETTPTPGVLDLRPAEESTRAELLRLGLEYDNTNDQGDETWRDYQRHLAAMFPAHTGEPVQVRDTVTGISQTLTLDQLRGIQRILVAGETE